MQVFIELKCFILLTFDSDKNKLICLKKLSKLKKKIQKHIKLLILYFILKFVTNKFCKSIKCKNVYKRINYKQT